MNTEMISDSLFETQPKQILRELNESNVQSSSHNQHRNAEKGIKEVMSHIEKVDRILKITSKDLEGCLSKYDELNSTFKDFTSNIISDALWE